ncbi:MAG: protein kinase, partial [Pseudomonadota bacterium]|nr:protein kinase [Pseudomonadota bacterium]
MSTHGAPGALPPGTPPFKKNLMALPIGFMLFEYRIDAILGQGGFGITYLATDINLNTKVAIKEYLPGDFAHRASDKSVSPRWPEDREHYQQGLDSFLIEARTLATFRHSHIVRVARFFEAHRTAYMVLEYERGKSLKDWWPGHTDLPEQELLILLQPLLDGLGAVHAAGYLHRDIKPDNIYVRRDDGSLVLLDFGAARHTAGDTRELAGAVTPGYAPPEQYDASKQGPSTDLYSLGATLYWMISGGKPPPAPLRLAGKDPLIPAEQVGRGKYTKQFLQAIDWALKLDQAERPRHMDEFRRALFAGYGATLGLQEALQLGDASGALSDNLITPRSKPLAWVSRKWRGLRAITRPQSWPIVVKMMLAMVLAALLPMLITAYYNLHGSLQTVSNDELQNLERLAQSTSGRLSQLLDDSRNLANYLGTDDDFVGYLNQPNETNRNAITAKLRSVVKANSDVQLLMVMTPDGTAIASSDPEVAGRNFKFREYFKIAMQNRPNMTGVIVGSVAGEAGIYYANPVDNANGAVMGVVVLRIKGAAVNAILSDARQGSERIPFLIDGDGVLIYHPDKNQLYRSLVPLSATQLSDIVADQRFRRSTIESVNMPELAHAMIGTTRQGNLSYHSTLSGKNEIVGFAPVRGQKWVVGVTETRDVFEAPLNRLFNNVLASVILVGAVFLVLAALFARSIVRPIERLTNAAHALKSGDYDKATIKVTSDDELGKLARTFNVMI